MLKILVLYLHELHQEEEEIMSLQDYLDILI